MRKVIINIFEVKILCLITINKVKIFKYNIEILQRSWLIIF